MNIVEQGEMSNIRPVVCIGDIHGQANQLRTLIDKVRERFGQNVKLYALGDFIDRGPNSREVIQICIDEGIKGLVGNHDWWLRLLVTEGKLDPFCFSGIMGGISTFLSYGVDVFSDGENYYPNRLGDRELAIALYNNIPDSHKKWLSKLPYYRKIEVDGETYWLNHAGLTHTNAIPFKNPPRLGGKIVEVSDDEMMKEISSKNPGLLMWPHPYIVPGIRDNLFKFDNAIQIFGHIELQKALVSKHFIALDTKYSLSAVILPAKEIIRIEDEVNWT